MLTSSGKIYIDEQGKEYVKKLDETGNEIIYYPPTEEEFFTEEDWEMIDGIKKLEASDIKNSLSEMNKVFSKYLI